MDEVDEDLRKAGFVDEATPEEARSTLCSFDFFRTTTIPISAPSTTTATTAPTTAPPEAPDDEPDPVVAGPPIAGL